MLESGTAATELDLARVEGKRGTLTGDASMIGRLIAVSILVAGISTPAFAHPHASARLVRDCAEDVRDRREDRFDRLEDVADRREDRRDARRFTGLGDLLEDVADRAEDRRDRREDRRDRREDRRDARYGCY